MKSAVLFGLSIFTAMLSGCATKDINDSIHIIGSVMGKKYAQKNPELSKSYLKIATDASERNYYNNISQKKRPDLCLIDTSTEGRSIFIFENKCPKAVYYTYIFKTSNGKYLQSKPHLVNSGAKARIGRSSTIDGEVKFHLFCFENPKEINEIEEFYLNGEYFKIQPKYTC